MESYKVFATFALLVACIYAAQAIEQQQQQQLPVGPNIPVPGPSSVSPLSADENGPLREKKQALYPYAYAAYPYAAYPYAAYPYAAYPYSYSYQYQDDGKYYPGKYEKPYYKSAAYPYYYPYYYY